MCLKNAPKKWNKSLFRELFFVCLFALWLKQAFSCTTAGWRAFLCCRLLPIMRFRPAVMIAYSSSISVQWDFLFYVLGKLYLESTSRWKRFRRQQNRKDFFLCLYLIGPCYVLRLLSLIFDFITLLFGKASTESWMKILWNYHFFPFDVKHFHFHLNSERKTQRKLKILQVHEKRFRYFCCFSTHNFYNSIYIISQKPGVVHK